MRRFVFVLALGLSPATPVAAYIAYPGGEFGPMPVSFSADTALSSPDRPACITRNFAIGEGPEYPSQIEQITCLDAMCTRRRIVLCASGD